MFFWWLCLTVSRLWSLGLFGLRGLGFRTLNPKPLNPNFGFGFTVVGQLTVAWLKMQEPCVYYRGLNNGWVARYAILIIRPPPKKKSIGDYLGPYSTRTHVHGSFRKCKATT